jgi:HAD superfamily hydrolase (TIGR01509 family)
MRELVSDAVGAGASPQTLREVGRRCLATYRLLFPEQTAPLPGAREVLSWCCSGTGGRVAVVSNKLSELSQEWLRRFDLDRFVAMVVGPDSFGVRKPDPKAVLPVLSRFGVRPADALLVGDMAVDAATGRAAGMPVVGVRQDGTSPDSLRLAGMLAVLFDLRDLPAWLAGNGSGWATMTRP